MKKIEAIIKPYLLEDVKEGLEEIGLIGVTVSEIKNYQTGVTSADPCSGFSPRLKLEVVVPESHFESALRCIQIHGHIPPDCPEQLFVQPLSDVVRIRTFEHGEEAI